MTNDSPGRQIGILLFEDVEELDAVGPWEVLAHWTRHYPEDGYAVSCLSADGRPVTGAKGLVLGAHLATAEAPPLEVSCTRAVAGPARFCATRLIWTGCGPSAPPCR